MSGATIHPFAPTNWFASCQRSSTGAPIPNLHNVLLALRNDPAWTGRLGFDQMLQTAVLADPTLNPPADRAMQDLDLFRIHEWLQDNGLQRIALDPVREAVEIVAAERTFHPIQDWFATLPPAAGYDDVMHWLHRYAGTPDDEYHRQVSLLFITSMVARVFKPGCKCDYVLVLEGPQRLLKSTLCSVLAGGDRYFSDSLPDITADKEVASHLAGKWVIEISELSAFQRADNEKLKSFLSRQIERYRPAYGRKQVTEPRQCVFIATTNKYVWMKDETGGTRFWPVRCGKIDLDGLRDKRHDIFAQALAFYQANHRWWPLHDIENDLFKPQQNARYEGDAWEKAVHDWDRSLPNGTDQFGDPIRIPLTPPLFLIDIARGAFNLPPDRFGVREQRRLVSVLETLGWTREPRTKRGIPWTPV